MSGNRGIRILAAASALMLTAVGLVASLPVRPAVADPPYTLGLPPGPQFSSPEYATNLDGRREAFVWGLKNEIYHSRELCPGCGQWSSWDSLGMNSNSPPKPIRQADGRIVVVAQGADGKIYYVRQRNPGSLEWDGWNPLGDQEIYSQPVVAVNADGRIEVFALLPPRQVNGLWVTEPAHIWQVAPNGSWSAWTGMGGNFPPVSASLTTGLAVGRNADGSLELVEVASCNNFDCGLYVARQPNWGSWTRLGGSWTEGQPEFVFKPFLVRDQDNRLEVFAVVYLTHDGSRRALVRLWQTSPNGVWSAPTIMPGTEEMGPWSISYVTTAADGRIELGIVDKNYLAQRTIQAPGSNDFQPWLPETIGYGPPQTSDAADLTPGRYTLTSVYSGKCLEVAASSTADGATVQQQTCADAPRQQWQVNPHPDGGFTLAAVHSGKCLEIAGSSVAEGAAAQQRTCSSGARNQEWRLDRAADGTYTLVPRHSEMCLDARLSTADGAPTVQWGCISAPQQRFRLTPAGPYMLVADHSGKCLDVLAASTADGATVDQWSCIDVDNLRFRPRVRPDGSVSLVAVHSGKCIEVAGGSTADGAAVQQRTCAEVPQQWFSMGQLLDGTYFITALHSGKCLNVTGASQDTGAPVTQHTCAGGANEHWRLVPAGTFTIVAAHSGKCAEVAGASTADGAAIQQRTCADVPQQRWRMAAGPDPGSVSLIATHSGKCLDATATPDNAVPAMQWPCNTGPTQRWLPGPLGDGNAFLVSANSQRCLDVNAAAITDGTTIDSWSCIPGAANEYWRLRPVPNS